VELLKEYQRIRDGLAVLRDAPVKNGDFGVSCHGFRVRPPLAEPQVAAFEARYHLSLPAGYRGFLLHVGNGGASPEFGMPGLGENHNGTVSEPWNPASVGDPAVPFPHTAAWDDRTDWPAIDTARAAADGRYEDEFYEALRPYEDEYFGTRHVSGTVPLCDRGCAMFTLLMVNGPEAGHIWDDYRADHAGLCPRERPGGSRVTFLDWYSEWLDEALRFFGTRGHV